MVYHVINVDAQYAFLSVTQYVWSTTRDTSYTEHQTAMYSGHVHVHSYKKLAACSSEIAPAIAVAAADVGSECK